jgi:hypothetical protein
MGSPLRRRPPEVILMKMPYEDAFLGHDAVPGLVVNGAPGMADPAYLADLALDALAQPNAGSYRKG